MGGNLARQWLDVSEWGFRAAVRKTLPVGAHVRAVQSSELFPGSVAAGIEFVNPTESFQELVRTLHGLDPDAGSLRPSRSVWGEFASCFLLTVRE